jgi:hypothetical protein
MTRSHLVVLLFLLGSGVLSAVPAGRAQSTSSRYAFADTTLLRDTLGLTFERLFPLADSLGMLPDTLRALAIRYRFLPQRLVVMADSMRVPVDSVGPVLLRERFNPLASAGGFSNQFSYNTTYNIQQTRSSWVNSSDYNMVRGPLFLRNSATITLDRFKSGTRISQRHDRTSTTELGWKLSDQYSIGGRAILGGYFSNDVSSVNRVGEDRTQFELSVRTRQKPLEGLESEVNLFSGMLGVSNQTQEKRGLSTDLNGRVQYSPTDWFSNDLAGSVVGNASRTRLVRNDVNQSTRDLSSSISGTLSLFSGRRIGFQSHYGWRSNRVESPLDSTRTQVLLTGGGDLDGTLQLRLDADRYLNVTQRFGTNKQNSVQSGQTTRDSWGFNADGRYFLAGWSLEPRFTHDYSNSEVPQLTPEGGTGEDVTNRLLNGILSRSLTPQLNARVTARIGLSSYRYYRIGRYTGSLSTPRDQYQQSYRIEGIYTASQKWNSSTALEVSRTHLVNIPSASTASNNVARSYRAEWSWSYRLLRGLTAAQSNQLVANYTSYDFVPANDRLSLDFRTTTRLNAVVNPRLSIDIQHTAQQQPSGDYGVQPDGLSYFRPADEGRTYQLSGTIAYAPISGFSLSLTPSYRAADRDGTQNGVAVPVRQSRSLNLDGTASLNLPVGRKGRLTGNIGRSYQADRTTAFSHGVPQPSPAAEFDFWNGSLQFSWQL